MIFALAPDNGWHWGLGALLRTVEVVPATTARRPLLPVSRLQRRGSNATDLRTNNSNGQIKRRRVLTAIEQSILMPEAVNYVVDRALRLVEERRRWEPDPTKRLEAEIRRLTRERDNLVNLAAHGKAHNRVAGDNEARACYCGIGR